MSDPAIEEALNPLRAAVKEIGEKVRQLKADDAPKLEIDRAVVELKACRRRLEEKELSLAPDHVVLFERTKLEDLLKRRFFWDQSFSIYAGIAGLYDLGPMGCGLKKNMIKVWENHFIVAENMLEVECSVLTPEPVLKASGHVDRFADWMVKDVGTGECFRADHLIKNYCEKLIQDKKTPEGTRAELTDVLARLEGFDNNDMQEVISKYGFKSPSTNNDLTPPIAFNLMFPTVIGPTGAVKAYLRPETAQGIFVNFKRLLEFNQGRLPFAAAQIGLGFRNEISPRQGLIRVREFTMCEIEHFVDPTDKRHPKFARVRDYQMTLFSACNQMDGRPAAMMTIGEAVDKKIVANETLGFYMARVHQFLLKVGVDATRLRFRQHLANEMAHYAQDCWDAECLTSYGWIECVGNADRACYDLQQHFKATGVKLAAERKLAEAKTVLVTKAEPNKAVIGKQFKQMASKIIEKLNALSVEEVEELEKELAGKGKYEMTVEGTKVELNGDAVAVRRQEEKVWVEEIIPSVIEPSFGIGRIMYTVLEHAFRIREGDEQRNFLALSPLVAPIKCSVLPLSRDAKLDVVVNEVISAFEQRHIAYKLDDSSGSIGRRYARTDEIGVPLGVTVDFDSLQEPHTVTLRELVSMEQVRMKVTEVADTVSQLANGFIDWAHVLAKYPKVEKKPDE